MPNDRTLAPLFLARGSRFIEAGRWARARGSPTSWWCRRCAGAAGQGRLQTASAIE